MSRPPDYIRSRYGPLREKTLHKAVVHTIGEQFPRIGGPRIRELCADMLLEVVAAHVRPREHVRHGQVLWMGVATDHPPRYRQRPRETKLVPVVLDLSTPEDVETRIDRKPSLERLQSKAVRLCYQAHDQGALLSNCDLAELLCVSDSFMARALTTYERKTEKLVPRRATLHDVGTGLTHKRMICLKHYAEGKSPDLVAQETYHSLEAVDRYLGQFDRVRHCRCQNMTPEETAYTLNCSRGLVEEYLAIDQELGRTHR
jgi:DNA-binding CsgD family transcriptional regulator